MAVSSDFQGGITNQLTADSIGIIAYNSTLATNNINAFESSLSDILKNLGSAYAKMMEDLNPNWASPAAQKFFNTSSEFIEVLESGRQKGNEIINSAIGAVREMARSNHSDYSYSTSVSFVSPSVDALRDNIDGYQGINMDNVNNIVLEFKSKVDNTLTGLDSIANSIAVYDKNNHVTSLYGDRIAELKNDVDSMAKKITGEIDKTVKKQEDALNSARSRIVSNMESSTPQIRL